MKNSTIIFLLISALFLGCTHKRIPEEGFINVKGGRVWYKIVGAEKKNTPILLLHGGPGFPSNYLSPLQALASDRPVIFYDQLGCGKSDKPDDSTLWKLDRFVKELATLRTALELDNVHLFAHSWGTMLTAEYMSIKPNGIKSIIFAGPIFSTSQHLKNVNQLKLGLPANIRDTLLFHEAKETIHSKAFQQAYGEFSKRYSSRLNPLPVEIDESIQHFSNQVFETMWGSYEFYCPGNLKNFERETVLKEIKVPTLFTCGRYDLITPESTEGYAKHVIGSEFVVLEKSAHFTMNEEPDVYVRVIRDFLNKNE